MPVEKAGLVLGRKICFLLLFYILVKDISNETILALEFEALGSFFGPGMFSEFEKNPLEKVQLNKISFVFVVCLKFCFFFY